MGLRLWGLWHGQLKSSHTSTISSPPGLSLFPTPSYFSDVQDESSLLVQWPFAAVLSTRRTAVKLPSLSCAFWVLHASAPTLLLWAPSCPQVLRVTVFGNLSQPLYTWRQAFHWLQGPLQASKVLKVAVLHLQEKHKHTLTPTLARARSFSRHDILPQHLASYPSVLWWQHHSTQWGCLLYH